MSEDLNVILILKRFRGASLETFSGGGQLKNHPVYALIFAIIPFVKNTPLCKKRTLSPGGNKTCVNFVTNCKTVSKLRKYDATIQN